MFAPRLGEPQVDLNAPEPMESPSAPRRTDVACDIVEKKESAGLFEQDTAADARTKKATPKSPNEHVMEHWLTVDGVDVRRIIRIQPGESAELDAARAELQRVKAARDVDVNTILRKARRKKR